MTYEGTYEDWHEDQQQELHQDEQFWAWVEAQEAAALEAMPPQGTPRKYRVTLTQGTGETFQIQNVKLETPAQFMGFGEREDIERQVQAQYPGWQLIDLQPLN